MNIAKIAAFKLGATPFEGRGLGGFPLGEVGDPVPAPAPAPAPDPHQPPVYWNPVQRPVQEVFLVDAPKPVTEVDALPKYLVPAIGIGLAGLVVGYLLSKN